MTQSIHVTVNGQVHTSEVEPRLLLVHYLREKLGLTGTNIGCDTSQCGACTTTVSEMLHAIALHALSTRVQLVDSASNW